MVWFLIGAAVASVQFVVSLVRQPIEDSVTGILLSFLVVALIGAVAYGTPLWLLVTFVF